jgi:hypothetical protein
VVEVEADLRAAEDVVGGQGFQHSASPVVRGFLILYPLALDAQMKRMEMEARSLPAETSKPLLINVKNYKADLLALKEQVKKAAAAASPADGARAELVSQEASKG